jgi:hypothetical protein
LPEQTGVLREAVGPATTSYDNWGSLVAGLRASCAHQSASAHAQAAARIQALPGEAVAWCAECVT